MDYGDGVLIGGVRGRPRYNCTLRDGMPVRNPKGKCAKKEVVELPWFHMILIIH